MRDHLTAALAAGALLGANEGTCFYDAKIGGGKSLPFGGLPVANVSAQAWMNLPTTLWVTPAKILGGDLAFSLTSSFGEPRINASLPINSPRFGPIGGNVTDADVNLGDSSDQSLSSGMKDRKRG
jgi:hypothetical protein